MKKKGNWIYLIDQTTGSLEYFVRVNIKKATSKLLVEGDSYYGNYPVRYVIKDKKIYYNWKHGSKRKMNLNGSSRKKTKIKAAMASKDSNTKGYKIIEKIKAGKDGTEYIVSYLKTPKGKYKLGKLVGGWN